MGKTTYQLVKTHQPIQDMLFSTCHICDTHNQWAGPEPGVLGLPWPLSRLALVHDWQVYIWVFPTIWEHHQIIHFNRVFHYFHHPFWGTTIYFWKHPYIYISNHIYFSANRSYKILWHIFNKKQAQSVPDTTHRNVLPPCSPSRLHASGFPHVTRDRSWRWYHFDQSNWRTSERGFAMTTALRPRPLGGWCFSWHSGVYSSLSWEQSREQ